MILTPILDLINKFVPDKDEARKLEVDIFKAHQKTLETAVKEDTRVRLVEMNSKGIVSKWRPLAAISTFSCLYLYWFIYPFMKIMIALFDLNIFLPELEPLPVEFYVLSGSFVTVYAYGRSKYDKRGL